MEGRKDAAYFLKRMNNLPEPRTHALRELSSECASRRMLPLNVGEVIKRLGLDTKKEDYLSDPLIELASLRSYILKAGIVFAPCGNPADVAFEDLLFLTPKPVFTNDEDISAVARISKSGRAPTKADFTAITRTTLKMGNYNVMLRVFENLCAVRGGMLGASQIDVLNRLLDQMELPLEGENYLRVCLSYASQVGVKHCDYKRPKTLYPPLGPKLDPKIDEYLANVLAAASYPQLPDPLYPRVIELRAACARLNFELHAASASDPSEHEREATMKFNRERAGVSDIPQAVAPVSNHYGFSTIAQTETRAFRTDPYSRSVTYFGTDTPEGRDRKSFLSKLRFNIPDVSERLRSNLEYNHARIMQGMPLPDKMWIERVPGSVRDDRFMIRGETIENDLLSYGIIPDGQNPLSFAQSDKRGHGLTEYLRGDVPSSPEEWNTLREISALIYFFALIAAPLLAGKSAFRYVGLNEIENSIRREYELSLKSRDQIQRPELAIIYALYRTIVNPRKIQEDCADPTMLRGLFLCPGVLNIYTQKATSAYWRDPDIKAQLKLPYMLAGLCEILKQHKPLNGLLGSAPLRPEFFSYCLSLFEEHGYFDGGCRIEDAPERRHDYGILPGPMTRLLRVPLASFIFENIVSRRSFNALSDLYFRVSDKAASEIAKHLRERKNVLAYLINTPASYPDIVAKALCGSLDKNELKSLRLALSELDLSSDTPRLGGILRGARDVLPDLLEKTGIIEVPDPSLPHEILRQLSFRSFFTPGKKFLEDRKLHERFIAAQCAVYLFMTIAPASRRANALIQLLEPPEEDISAISHAFEQIESHCQKLTPRTPTQIKAMGFNRMGSELNGFMQRCLKKLVSIELAHSVFANYERSRFDDLFKNLGIREVINQGNERSQSRATSVFDNLDKDLIKKHVSETREVERVITKIKEEEDQKEAVFQINIQSQNIKNSEPEKTAELITDDKSAAMGADSPSPGSQALELLKSVAAQSSDAIDSKEFEGLCRSHGFMSGDAAIEEINDWCFDNLDQGVFEAAPEDGCVYISNDVLSEILKN